MKPSLQNMSKLWLANAVKIVVAVVTFAAQAGALERNAFGYSDLVQLIQQRGLKSIDEVVPLLPAEFKDNFTLMRNSRSLQRSDSLNPRAILFNDTAQTILTFGGLKGQPASANFEVMEFDPKSNTFHLHEIAFADGGVHIATDQEIKQRCSSCHGEFVHPIWFKYPMWTGAFGARDDYLTDNAPSSEIEAYTAFRSANANRPAFNWLYSGHETDAYWPYSLSYEKRVDARMPNFRLELMLSMSWARAAAAQMIRSPLFESAKYTLVDKTHFTGSSSFEGLESLVNAAPIPAELHWTQSRAAWKRRILDEGNIFEVFGIPHGDLSLNLERETGAITPTGIFLGSVSNDTAAYVGALIAEYVIARDPKLGQLTGERPPYDGTGAENAGSSPLIFKQAVESSPLNASFKLDQFYLSDRVRAEQQAMKSRKFAAPTLTPTSVAQSPAGSGAAVRLSRASAVAQGMPRVSISPRTKVETSAGMKVIERVGCLGCHGGSGIAPTIHFDQPSIFKTQNLTAARQGQSLLIKVRNRITSNDPLFRMPFQGEALSPADQRAVLNYLLQATK